MAINRYSQLLASVPKGSFYSSNGQVLPFRSSPYQLRITTSSAATEHAVYVNGTFKGSVVTDAEGVALLNIKLDHGENEIELVNTVSLQPTKAWITTRDYATMLAGLAEVVESIDTDVEQLLDDARLDTASAGLVEDVFGKVVLAPNDVAYVLDTYKELLRELRIAYRYYGGTTEGISRAVRAYTQVSPLMYDRSFGPAWELGKDILYKPRSRSVHPAIAANLPGSQGTGSGIRVVKAIGQMFPGGCTFNLDGTTNPKKMRFASSFGFMGDYVDITGNGQYTVYDGKFIPEIIGETGTYTITAGVNDKLTIEIADRGRLPVVLTAGVRTAAQICTDINNAISVSLAYGAGFGSPAIAWNSTNVSFVGLGGRSVTIHETDGASDATQTLFNLPAVRGGLLNNHAAGATSLTLSASSSIDGWPSASTQQPLNVIVGRTTFHNVGAPSAVATITTKELVKVVAVDKTTKTLTLQSGLINNQNQGVTVELEGQLPYSRPMAASDRAIVVQVDDYTALPTSNVFEGFTLNGTGLHDGWVMTDSVGAPTTSVSGVKRTHFQTDRDLPFSIGGSRIVSFPVPDDIVKYKDIPVKLSVWASQSDPSVSSASAVTIEELGFSWDNQDHYSSREPITAGLYNRAMNRPKQYSITTPVGAPMPAGHVLDAVNTLGLWRVDESVVSAAAEDQTTYNQDLTVSSNGGGPPITPGLIDNCRQFRSNIGKAFIGTAGATLRDAVGIGAYTYESWVRPISGGSAGELFMVNGAEFTFTSGDTVLMQIELTADGKFRWCQWSDPNPFAIQLGPQTQLTVGEWNHIAVTRTARNGSGEHTYKTYLNGVLTSTTSNVPGLSNAEVTALGTRTQYIGLGCYRDIAGPLVASAPPNADIDDTRVTSGVLGDADILASYQRGSPSRNPLTKVWGRVKLSSGTGTLDIHKIRITVPGVHSGLFTGDGTIPRNESKVKQGQFMYIWSPDPLSSAEEAHLGLETINQSKTGHIDRLAPASVWLDKYDATVYSGSTPTNLFGAYTNAHFSVGSKTNLNTVVRTPARFTHLVPTVVSEQTQDVQFSTSGPYSATLTVAADQNQSAAWLLEDGVPLTRDEWSFASSTSIIKTTAPSTTAKYTLIYNALIRFTTDIIDAGASHKDFLWFADAHVWTRPQVSTQEVDLDVGIQFDGNGVAVLAEISNEDQLVSTLTEEDGLRKRTVPMGSWSYLDSSRIAISQGEFNPNAIYSLSYRAVVSHPTAQPTVKLEIKSSATSDGVTTATWVEFKPNHVIDGGNRYHQMRATISNVVDVRDVKVQSLLIKGLGLFGSGTVPVLKP